MRIIILFLSVSLSFLGCGFGSSQTEEPEENQDPYSWDFGQVSQGEIITHAFTLKNDSPDALNIKDVYTSCGCTASEIEKKEIPPGESINIQVTFDTRGYSGIKEQSVYIHTDEQEEPTFKLTIKADIQN